MSVVKLDKQNCQEVMIVINTRGYMKMEQYQVIHRKGLSPSSRFS